MGSAVEGQIAQAHIAHQLHSAADFFERFFGNQRLGVFEADGGEEVTGVFDGDRSQLRHIAVVDFDRQGFGAQAAAVALCTGLYPHVLLEFAALSFFGPAEFFFQKLDHALVLVFVRPGIVAQIGVGKGDFLLAESVEEVVLLRVVEFFPGSIEVEAEVFGGAFVKMQAPAIVLDCTEGLERACTDGSGRIGDHQVLAHYDLGAETAAIRAHALGVVEGKTLRCRLLIGDPTGGTVETGTEQDVLLILARDDKGALPEAQGVIDGLCQTGGLLFLFPQDQAVDHYLDIVAAVAVQRRGLVDGEELTVDAHADISRFLQVREEFVVLSFALLDYG